MLDDRPHVCVPRGEATWMHLHIEDRQGVCCYVLCAAVRGEDTCRCGLYTLIWEEDDDACEE